MHKLVGTRYQKINVMRIAPVGIIIITYIHLWYLNDAKNVRTSLSSTK